MTDSTPAIERVAEIFEAFNVPHGDSEQSARDAIRATLVVDEIATIIDESLMGYAPGTYDQVRTGTWDAWNDSIDTHTIATEIVARLLGEQPT